MHDQLATGKKLRVLTVVDAYSRFSPVIDPRYAYRGEDVGVSSPCTTAPPSESQALDVSP